MYRKINIYDYEDVVESWSKKIYFWSQKVTDQKKSF
jgi:hypothetical protein